MSTSTRNRERVLVVDDEEAMRTFVVRSLEKHGLEVLEADDGEAARDLLEKEEVALVLTDLRMPRLDGMSLLAWIHEKWPRLPVIVMTAYGSIPSAIEALKSGAQDYVTKPFDRDEILKAVDNALQSSRLAAENRMLRRLLEEGRRFGTMVGSSAPMRELYGLIDAVAHRSGAVLVTGESGTGKELVARAVHHRSPRVDGPFVALHLGAIPPTLVAAELFGVEVGAYTGAGAPRRGAARRADGGVLFLDEIGDVPLEVQSSLLRLLEQGEVTPMGASQTETVDIRVVAATQRDLAELIDAGQFRQDLYFRLNVFMLEVPPLRRRREDIADLVRHFLALAGEDDRELSLETLAQLEAHDWPGNVRELENAVARMVAMSDEGPLLSEHLPEVIRERGPVQRRELGDYKEALAAFEMEFFLDLMRATSGNVSEAARRAGMSRPTLHAKLQRLRVDPDRFR